VPRYMPIVSINLTDSAFKAYKAWRDHGRSASRKVSIAIERLWNQEDIVPALQPGDRRVSVTGDALVWTGQGWEVDE
jgi:hypothetical protein